MAYLSPFLYCTLIIAQSPLFVKWFFKIFWIGFPSFQVIRRRLALPTTLFRFCCPSFILSLLYHRLFGLSRGFLRFFSFFVFLFPYLVNILQQKFLKKSTSNFALISGYNFVQFFRRFRLTKYAEHGIMEFSPRSGGSRRAHKKAGEFLPPPASLFLGAMLNQFQTVFLTLKGEGDFRFSFHPEDFSTQTLKQNLAVHQ